MQELSPLFSLTQKMGKCLIGAHMLHFLSAGPCTGDFASADKPQVIVINHESHDTLRMLNGKKFVTELCVSSWLERPELDLLVSICAEEKYFFSLPICISLNSEGLLGLVFCISFGHFSSFQCLT